MTTKKLTTPEQHQLKIARQTLKMNDSFVSIMGGMTKKEAEQIIKRLTGNEAKNVRI